MKKSYLILLAALLGLAACGGGNASSSASSSAASSSAESSVSSESSSSASVSSESSSAEPQKSDKNWVDYARGGSIKLALEYEGHDFYTDGIEQVSLYNPIDGDTAHFTPKSGGLTIKSRFFGIDTPESTGKVQPYGKSASNFTKEQLKLADKQGTIVVASAQESYGTPNPDSTGSRYVSCIWINTEKQNAPIEELHLLNLLIVQEGYSWVKNIGAMPSYGDTFYAAENQAKTYKLVLHSGLPDPLYNYGDYEDTSLLDIKKEVVACLNDSSHTNAYDNKKVRVQGTVSGFANHILYIQDFYPEYDENGDPIVDEEGNIVGEYAGINIFCGMSSVLSKFKKPNTYIQVCGLALDSQFGFQITDVSLPTLAYDENDGQVLIKPENNTEEHALYTFQYTTAELNKVISDKNYESLYCAVEVTDALTVNGGYKADGGEISLYFSEGNFDAYFTFNYQPYPVTDPAVNWTEVDQFKGHTFLLSGVLATHTTTSGKLRMQIYPRSSEDIVLVS